MNGETPALPHPGGRGYGLDTRRPNVARMFDYYLGGKDNLAVDREAAERVLAVAPEIPLAARENRDFLVRVIRHLTVECGIGQFVDIGPGLPTQANVHHIAHRFDPLARVAYVDHDPTVIAHGQALLTGNEPGLAMVDGDLREPDKILSNPAVRQLVDFSQPVALCLTLVLHFIGGAEQPYECVARLLDAVAPRSYLIISHVTGDGRNPDVLDEITTTYGAANSPLVMRNRDEVTRFFRGCALVSPGVVYLTQWHADSSATPGDGGTRWAYAGVGVK